MKTSTKYQKKNSVTALIMLMLFAFTTPAFSQDNSHSLFSYIDVTMVLSILGVAVLAAFMFVAMVKAKNKEHREMEQEHKQRHRLHIHRRHAHVNHFKY